MIANLQVLRVIQNWTDRDFVYLVTSEDGLEYPGADILLLEDYNIWWSDEHMVGDHPPAYWNNKWWTYHYKHMLPYWTANSLLRSEIVLIP